ncbi:MAG: hypothetical protein GF347_05595 [Candidatus Moranbacteria bacterium]|nr:hypothetical protein [Candidatus Moranbacteria bacterium]
MIRKFLIFILIFLVLGCSRNNQQEVKESEIVGQECEEPGYMYCTLKKTCIDIEKEECNEEQVFFDDIQLMNKIKKESNLDFSVVEENQDNSWMGKNDHVLVKGSKTMSLSKATDTDLLILEDFFSKNNFEVSEMNCGMNVNGVQYKGYQKGYFACVVTSSLYTNPDEEAEIILDCWDMKTIY